MEAPTPCLQAPTWRKLRLPALHHPTTLNKLVHAMFLSSMSLVIITLLLLISTSVLPLSLSFILSLSLFFQLTHFYAITLPEAWVSDAKFITLKLDHWEPITSHQIPNFTCQGSSSGGQSPIAKYRTSSAKGQALRVNHQLSNTELQVPRAEIWKPITNYQMSRAKFQEPITAH